MAALIFLILCYAVIKLTGKLLRALFRPRPVNRTRMPAYSAPQLYVPSETTAIRSARDTERRRKEQEAQRRRAESDARRKEQEARRAEVQSAREAKKEQDKAQAADDVVFFTEQAALLREILKDTESRKADLRDTLERDKQLNEYAPGAVSPKIIAKNTREHDKLAKQIITLRNQIHSFETKIGKAYYLIGA